MHINNFIQFLNENNSNLDEQIKELMMGGNDLEHFMEALELKYGDTISLYHATTLENAEIIDQQGFKLTYGKNYKSFAHEEIIYFQIAKSDYVATNRPVLYRLDVPIDFIGSYAEADMDNVSDVDTLIESLGVNTDDMYSEFRDYFKYYVWNDMSFDGMELLITDRSGEEIDIFEGLVPIKVS